MKKLALTVVCLVAIASYAQQYGQFDFNNYKTAAGINAPVFDALGAKLEGTDYLAQLYAGPSATELYAQGTPAPFRTGTGAGYWLTTAAYNPVTLSGGDWALAGKTVFVEVRAWKVADGTTWEAAKAAGGNWGQSAALQLVSGNAGTPPSLPAVLTGLTSFSLVPEPSVIALGILGAAVLALRRRK
jgi:hypothetical protein